MNARHTPRGIPVSSGASPRPLIVANGVVGLSGLVRSGVGLVIGLWKVSGEGLRFLVNGSLPTYEINGKGKRSFPIKFRLNLFKGSQGSGQGPEVLNGVQW